MANTKAVLEELFLGYREYSGLWFVRKNKKSKLQLSFSKLIGFSGRLVALTRMIYSG